MAPIKPLAVALCAAALLCIAVGPSAGVLLCKDQQIALTLGNQLGGCQTATLNQDAIVTASKPTNNSNTVVTWGGPQPKVVVVGGAITNFVFLGGVDYSYTATNANETACTGTVSITPCQAVCRDLDLVVNATKSNDTCSLKIGAALFSETDFIDDASVGSAATNYSITSPKDGKLAFGGQSYSVGKWSIKAQITYPNGLSAVSDPCTVTIKDVTPYTAPAVNAAATCFYSNNTGKANYRIALKQIASLPSGPKCPKLRLVANECAPVKRPRICLPQNQPVTMSAQTPVNSLDITRKNARAKQELTVTLQVADVFGLKGSTSKATIKVYKSKALVPSADKATCVPIHAKI